MGKQPPRSLAQKKKKLWTKKVENQKNTKNNIEQAKGSDNDPYQIHNVPKNDEKKPERIRAVIQIVQESIKIFKRTLKKYDQSHSSQKPIILKLVTSQQEQHLSKIMWHFQKLTRQNDRKKDIYKILYGQEQKIQIPVKRIFRQIIYQIYYQKQNYEQIWSNFQRNKQKSKTQENIRLLKQYLSFEVTDFRDQSVQKQKQMKERQRTKIKEEQPQKLYKYPTTKSEYRVKQFIAELVKKPSTGLMNENSGMQEEKYSQQCSNEQDFEPERMQEQKIQSSFISHEKNSIDALQFNIITNYLSKEALIKNKQNQQ